LFLTLQTLVNTVREARRAQTPIRTKHGCVWTGSRLCTQRRPSFRCGTAGAPRVVMIQCVKSPPSVTSATSLQRSF